MYNLYDLDCALVDEVPEVRAVNDVANPSLPFILKSSEVVVTLANSSPCRLNMLVFKAGLIKASEARTQSTMQKADNVRPTLIKHVARLGQTILDHHQILHDVVLFGSKRGAEYVGLDRTCMFTAKALASPTSSIHYFLFPLNKVLKYIDEKCGAAATILEVKKWLKNISQEALDMAAAAHIVHRCILMTNDILVIPAGWLVCEKTLNTVATGIQINFVPFACDDTKANVSRVVDLAAATSASAQDGASCIHFRCDMQFRKPGFQSSNPI